MAQTYFKQLFLALLLAGGIQNAYASSSSGCATCTNDSGSTTNPTLSNQDASCCTDSEVCGNVVCKSVFLPFSQGDNKARDYSLIRPWEYKDEDKRTWHFDVAVEFQQNFKRDDLGAYFLPNGTNVLHVGPDLSPALEGATDPLVDVSNFELLLSPTFDGTLTIRPRIRNVIVEPQFFIELDKFMCEGAWVWTKIPIVHTRWFLDCCETVSEAGGAQMTLISAGGLATPGTIIPLEFNNTVTYNNAPAFGMSNQIQQAFGGVLTTGDRKDPLSSSKIICCEAFTNGIADLPVEFGYNFIQKEKGYAGAYLRLVFPTGKIFNRNSIFDPTIGYKRWQLGAGMNFGATLWENDETAVRLIADGHYTHIFQTSQCRQFDLAANGCFSRYLLMFEALKHVPSTAVPNTTQINYTGNITAFADAFNICVKSGFDWNFDGVVFLQGQHKGFTADVGYEVKARSREKLTFKAASSHICDPCEGDCGDCCQAFAPENLQYAIKGILPTPAPNTNLQCATNSMSTARINNATNGLSSTLATDSPTQFINAGNVESQLNFCSGTIPAALSHKVWGDIGYRWEDREYPYYLGAGAEGEFGHKNTALSLWGVWVKGGVSYN